MAVDVRCKPFCTWAAIFERVFVQEQEEEEGKLATQEEARKPNKARVPLRRLRVRRSCWQMPDLSFALGEEDTVLLESEAVSEFAIDASVLARGCYGRGEWVSLSRPLLRMRMPRTGSCETSAK